jgi:uncharacterized protein
MRTDSEAAVATDARGRGRFGLIFAAALSGFIAGDAWEPPGSQISTSIAVRAIDVYRATLSPILARTGIVACRFQPTCSAYAREALTRYGIAKGAALAAGRLLRCQPFAKGGADPVP